MTAAQRLAALDDLPARDLIGLTEETLGALTEIMNRETTLLRSGQFREASNVVADKTRLAQEYVGYSRAVQRQLARLKSEAPDEVARLKSGHERLTTQLSENLKVIATARTVTQDLLTDVAERVASIGRPKTYGAGGEMSPAPSASNGIAVNRAL